MNTRYALTDPMVQRVIETLRTTNDNYGHKTLEDVVLRYNALYPPSLVRRVIGSKVTKHQILPILKFLEQEPQNLVVGEIFSFWRKRLDAPTKFYVLTQKGIQYVHERKSSSR